jgi:hypothetical protein
MRIGIRQLAVAALLASGTIVCAHSPAQDAGDAHWLLEYRGVKANGTDSSNRLKWDKRFVPFVNHYLPMPQTFWSKGDSLGAVASDFLGIPGEIHIEGDQFYEADGCGAHACFEKGMVWVDLTASPPTVVFAATDLRKGANAHGYTLWLFASRTLNPDQLPGELRFSIERWTAKPYGGSTRAADIETIRQAVIVGPDGNNQTVEPASVGVAEAAQEKPE